MQNVCVHTCCDTCHPDPDNLANEDSLADNKDIALASAMKSRDKRVTTKDTAPNSNMVPWSGPVSTQMVSSLRATVEPGTHMEPTAVDQNS